MSDMAVTIVPKSDQLNADDLLAGPRTITITGVVISPGAEQPVDVQFDGDSGKPFRPGKSMRRIMVAVWGPDPAIYVGRRMTIFRDPSVTWGGMEVGGIRISHMSNMAGPMTMALTATKKARKPYTVQPLADEPDRAREGAEALAAKLRAATGEERAALLADPRVVRQTDWMRQNRPELLVMVMGIPEVEQ
jgi:hypothetical protein